MLKKLFYKFKLSLYTKTIFKKYKFEVFIENCDEPFVYEYPYFSTFNVEEIAKIIFCEGICVDNWFINPNQISSLKLITTIDKNVFLRSDKYSIYDMFDLKTLEEINNKYLKDQRKNLI